MTSVLGVVCSSVLEDGLVKSSYICDFDFSMIYFMFCFWVPFWGPFSHCVFLRYVLFMFGLGG